MTEHYHYPEEPEQPIALPPDLAEFLREQEVACLMQGTDRGTAFVIKLPLTEILSVRGRVPIHVRHELYALPTAPVIRTLIGIYDQPASPLILETFTNVGDEQQRADFAALAEQEEFGMLFYDQSLFHRLSKVVPQVPDREASRIVPLAQQHLAQIPPEQVDFDTAKQLVVERTAF